MAGESSGIVPVNNSNLSLLECLDENIGLFPTVNQSNVSEQAIETLNNVSTICLLDKYKHFQLECFDEYRNGFNDSNDEQEFEDSDDEDIESVENIDQFEEDEDVLMLKQVRRFIEKIVQMSELFNFIKSKILDKNDEDVRDNKSESDIVMPPILKPVKTIWCKFNPPYFKNKYHFSSRKNKDVKLREENGFLPNFEWAQFSRNCWTLSDRKNLSCFIKEQIIEKEVERLKSEQRRLRRMLKEDDQSNIRVYDISKEIEKMSGQSVTKLMEGKDGWEFDWEKISIHGFKNRHSSNECCRYWHLYLKPSINKKRWSKSEDETLVSLVKKYNYQNWEKISEELGTNRSPFQVSIHYEVRFNDQEDYRKKLGKWTPEEDKELLEILKSCTFDGRIRWRRVSFLTGRSVLQLWHHYWQCSNPEIVKGRFTKEEDMMIVSGIQEFGFNSIMLSGLLKHRTTSQIMSRYRRLIPDNTIAGPWEIHEDELLMKLVKKHGFGQWSKIAKQFITRSRTQVRQRYNHIQRRMEQNEKFEIVQLNRRKRRKIVNKSANVDNMIGKVMNKIKQFKHDLSVDSYSSKFDQIYDLKSHIFSKPSTKPYWSEDNMLDRKLIDFFHEKCHPCKYVRNYDIEDISDLATRTLCSLVYLNVTTLKTITKADIENDDRVNDLLRSVLVELMDGDVLDLQLPLVKQKLLKLRCADEMIVENDSVDELEIDYSAPSTSKQVVYKRRKRNNNCNEYAISSSETIDYCPVKREDYLVDLKDRWLYSEIVIKDIKTSQLILGNLDEFSFGVYKFLKKEANCKSQTMTDLCSVPSNTKLPIALSKQLQISDSKFDEIYQNNCYKLPINVSSLIFLRTLELSKIKLEDTLIDEKIIIQDLNELPEITLNKNNPPFISEARYTRRFNEKEYVSDRVMELPATKLLIKRICDVLHWTMLMTKVEIDCEKLSINKPKPRLQSRISTSVRLKKRQIRETYINDVHEIPKRKPIRKLRRKKKMDEDNGDDYEDISD